MKNITTITTRSGSTYRLEGDTLHVYRVDGRGGMPIGLEYVVPDGTFGNARLVGHVEKGVRAVFTTDRGAIRTTPVVSVRRTRILGGAA